MSDELWLRAHYIDGWLVLAQDFPWKGEDQNCWCDKRDRFLQACTESHVPVPDRTKDFKGSGMQMAVKLEPRQLKPFLHRLSVLYDVSTFGRIKIDLTHVKHLLDECQNCKSLEARLEKLRAVLHNLTHTLMLAQRGLEGWAFEVSDAINGIDIKDLELGKLCSICRQPQYSTPSGPTCSNGHGGAPSVVEEGLVAG